MKRLFVLSVVIGIGLLGWSSFVRAEAGADGATQADRPAAKAAREAARKARKEAKAKAREEAAANKDQRDDQKTPNRDKRIDRREDNQARRINQGIKKGYLTDDEVATLKSQQDRIAATEDSIKADGKITKDEFRSINQALNDASRCIWAEKHDTDGKQMPTYRLGKNVFARNDFTAKMADENLSREEAKALLKDFHRLTTLKRTLATGDLTDAERKASQDEYDNLLNKYFEVR